MNPIAIGVALLALFVGGSEAADEPTPKRPNIVLFLVDDLGWQDISVPLHTEPTFQNGHYRTPHALRLAAEGMRFTDAYASAPVCTPTRTSILTGQSPGRSHITYWTLHKDQDTSRKHPSLNPPKWNMSGVAEDAVTLPRLLRDAGYRTIHCGKAHFAARGTPGADPKKLGFDVNIAGHAAGAPASYYGQHDFSQAKRRGKDDGLPSVWDVPGLEKYYGKDVYLTEALTAEAADAIGDAVRDGRPFFLNFAPYAVHTPIMANRKYLGNYNGVHPQQAAYATMVESVDVALGVLRARIEELGVTRETIIIYSSDNGGLSAHGRGPTPHIHNAPLKSGKGSAYEGGTRVPTIIAWPGVTEKDSVCRTPVVSHDFFPTILGMAGVPVPESYGQQVDGQDLSPLLRGKPGFDVSRVIAWNQPHQWGASGPGISPFTSLRDGPWKLIYFHAPRRLELYDLSRDIGEEHDLATTEPVRVKSLAQKLDVWIEEVGAQLSVDKETGKSIEGPGALTAER